MKREDFDRILVEFGAVQENEKGQARYKLPGGTLLSFYAASAGVPLSVSKTDEVRCNEGLLFLRTARGETFALALEDLFSIAKESSASGPSGRRAGFGP